MNKTGGYEYKETIFLDSSSFALGEAYKEAADSSVLIIGLIILAAPVLSVYMDKAGTAMFFYSGKAHGDKDRKNRFVRCVLSMMIFGMILLTGYMNGCAMSKQERLAEELDGQQPGGIEGKVYEIRQSGDEWRVYVYAEWITFGGGRLRRN